MDEYIKLNDAICAIAEGARIFASSQLNIGAAMMSAFGEIKKADVRENVRGSWIWDDDGYDWGIGAYICSNCKARPGTWWAGNRDKNPLLCSGGSYCGNCGAYMRGDDNGSGKDKSGNM